MSSALALVLTLTSLGQTDSLFEKFFDDFAKNRDAIQTLQTRFSQETITPDEILVSTGTITYTNPKRLIFRYDDPELVYIIDGQNFYDYDPEIEQLQIFQIEDRPEAEAFFLGLSNNTERLREAYTMQVLPPIDPKRGGVGLLLLPRKKEGEEPLFERVVLQLDAKHFLPTQIHIVNDEESEVVYTLEEFAINEPLGIDETHIFLPEGTVIVKDDEYVGTVGPEGKRMPEPTPTPEPDAATTDPPQPQQDPPAP